MGKVNVLVTGAGGAGVGAQALKALRIAATPYRIVATDITQYSSVFCQSDRAYVVPPAKDSNYIPEILEICHKENIQALVPGSEQELTKILKCREEFVKMDVLLLMNSTKVVQLCMDKRKTYEFLRDNGFNAPLTIEIDATNHESLGDLKLPVIVKPLSDSRGSSNVYLAQDWEEVYFFSRYLSKQGIKPLVQEYIGSCEEEYTVGVLTDMTNGSLIGSIALKRQILGGISNRLKIKNRLSATRHSDVLAISSGISQGVFDDFPDVRDCCERIALKLGSKGAMNIQCRKDDSGVYPFEINPRHSGTTYLRAMVGFNEPDILIRKHILNEHIDRLGYQKGVVIRGISDYLLPLDIVKTQNP